MPTKNAIFPAKELLFPLVGDPLNFRYIDGETHNFYLKGEEEKEEEGIGLVGG